MTLLKTAIITSALLISTSATASIEYIRFEGSIINFYDDFNPGYDQTLGFTSNQSIYFDFQLDTALDSISHPDSGFQDNFSVTYLGGSYNYTTGPQATHGETSTFPEGITSWLFITDTLFVGTSWDWLANPSDESINTWAVGDGIALMNNSYFSDYIIGNMEMTYRGSSIPPVVTPVPAAAWLFGSGLVGLAGIARRKKA